MARYGGKAATEELERLARAGIDVERGDIMLQRAGPEDYQVCEYCTGLSTPARPCQCFKARRARRDALPEDQRDILGVTSEGELLDEGEVRLSVEGRGDMVVVIYERRLQWVGMTPRVAQEFARELWGIAYEIEHR